MAEQTHTEKMVQAFIDENPFAERAKYLLSLVAKNDDPAMIASLNGEAQANATLAFANEQRQTRYDLETAIANHAQQTMAP